MKQRPQPIPITVAGSVHWLWITLGWTSYALAIMSQAGAFASIAGWTLAGIRMTTANWWWMSPTCIALTLIGMVRMRSACPETYSPFGKIQIDRIRPRWLLKPVAAAIALCILTMILASAVGGAAKADRASAPADASPAEWPWDSFTSGILTVFFTVAGLSFLCRPEACGEKSLPARRVD